MDSSASTDPASPDTTFDYPSDARTRNWLASLLLRQHQTWFGRFTLQLRQLFALQRGQRRRLERKAAVSLAGAALVLSLGAGMLRPLPVHAASITVDNGVVAPANDGDCSLWEAIINANGDSQLYASVGECAAGSGPDTIYLPAAGLFTLTTSTTYAFGSLTGLPVLASDITIEGNGSTIIRDSLAPNFRIMAVSPTGDVTLNDLTLSGGRTEETGGAIRIESAPVKINNSTFTDNRTVYYDVGGAIRNINGAVTISSSTFTNNHAGDEGGAIAHSSGNLNINQSTFTGNTVDDDGGAIVNFSGTVTIANSTFTLNSASAGGAIYNDATLIVTNSTISGNDAGANGGGIFNFASLSITRSIVSGNTAVIAGDEIFNITSGSSPANSFNIIGHSGITTSSALNNFTPDATDLVATSDGTSPTALAAILSPTLANNGGPTETLALVANSPAIDFIPTADCVPAPVNNVDQRAEPRGVNIPGTGSDTTNLCDVGAYEVQLTGVGLYCPADTAGVGNLLTSAIGTGQGNSTKGFKTRKLVVPNSVAVDSLYGQLAAVEVGVMKYVRFLPQGYPKIQIHPPTSPAHTYHAVDWWGSDLPADAGWVKGQFFWGAKGNKAPRAFVLWPTYTTAEPYANVFEVFDDSFTNHVANAVGFFSTQTQTVAIPATTADGADVNVTVAVVDVDGNGRSVILTVEAGGVDETRVISAPNSKDLLNLEEFTLPDVPAGTDEVTITLESPPVGIDYPLGGESAAMIGAAANYECAVP